MPVGAIIGAAGMIGGAILGGNAQKKASAQANDASQAATQAQLQLGQQSLAVQQQLAQQSMALQERLSGQSMAANLGIYNSNYDLLSPFVSRGNVAGDAINALLGLPSAPAMTSPMKNGIPQFPGVNAPLPGAPATPAPGTPAPGTPAAPMSLDQWYTGALNALLPNITQADNIAAINAAPTPEAKLAAALAISPPSSDQYAGYAAYIQANPKPAAAPAPAPSPSPAPAPGGAPGGTPATNAVVAQQPAAASGGYPRMADFMGADGFDLAAYNAARDAHSSGAAPVPANNPAPVVSGPGAPAAARGDRPVFSDYAGGREYLEALQAWRTTGGTPAAGGATPPGATPAASGAAAKTPQQSAFEQFANSAGMQFQLETGADAINNLYAGRGALQSGASAKALSDYAQQTAIQNYFMPYMSLLGGQQATGAQAGSAVAGVGSSFANTAANINSGAANAATGINSGLANATTGINAGMGGAIGQGANAAAQHAYNNGAANAGMWGSIGGALGNFAGTMFPSGGY